MADDSQPDRKTPAQPPGGGKQDHDVMRAAAMHRVTGPASTDTLAAGGGLDVPGREAHPEFADSRGPSHGGDAPAMPPPHEPIPGERDPGNLTHREPGAMGGPFAGGDIPAPDSHSWLDDRTAGEHAREGGGSPSRKSTDRKHR
jgi:hypothetical protein